MAASGPLSRTRRATGSLKRRLLRFELLDQRRVLASITGQVFHDADLSLRKGESESGLVDRVVYLDLNNNSEVDHGEPLRLTDADGRFEFADLAPGDYVVRLFNGTESQHQNFPFVPESYGDEIPTVDGFSEETASLTGLAGDMGPFGYTAAGNLLTEINLDAAQTIALDLDSEIGGFQPLGDGQVLAWLAGGTDEDGGGLPLAVIASARDGSVTELDLILPETTPKIRDLALAENDQGLFLPHFDGDSSVPLHRFALDVESQTWTTKQLELNVSSTSQLLASPSGPLVLVAQQTSAGTQVALVSTVTESVVSSANIFESEQFQFLAFDDSADLAVARNASGSIVVFDTANNFQTLRTITGWDGPLALDGHRELLFGLTGDGELQVYDIVTGETLATLTLGADFSTTAAVALTDGGDRLLLRRPAGVSQVRIDQIAGHHVTIEDDLQVSAGEQNTDLLFGMVLEHENLQPSFNTPPAFQMLEDQNLFSPAPGLLLGLNNPEFDQHIVIQVSQPQHGVAVVNPNGSLTYRPNADFFGTDSFNITVVDGRDAVKDVPVVINIMPVDDGPRGIILDIPPIGELTQGPAIIGTIQVDEVDGDDYVITISDPRFVVDGDNVVLVDGAELDFEQEPTISITITVVNPENEEDQGTYTTMLTVADEDDPPTDILPHTAEVFENMYGAEIAFLTLVDQDDSSDYILSVSDPRFIIVDRVLKLVDLIALDHEVEPTLTLTITAASLEGVTLLTRDILVTVIDTDDEISDIRLSRLDVPELASGYTVGAVQVIDQDRNGGHSLGVDDSRFEIVDAQLKLRNGVYVLRSEQAEIQVTITAAPFNSAGQSMSKQFILNVTSNESPWHNEELPTDVNNDGRTDPLDALIIINSLNHSGPRELLDPISYEEGEPRFYDVNGDGKITPIDALIIINALNRGNVGSAESGGDDTTSGSGEGEAIADDILAMPVPPIGFDNRDDDEEDDHPAY